MEKSRKTFVYCATNSVNGKRYIGVTVDLGNRKREHFHRAMSSKRSQTKFTAAIKKYGKDAFEFAVLSTWDTREGALMEEIRLIAEEHPEYNITAGGDGIPMQDRSKYPDWYRKVSATLKGRKPSPLAAERWKQMAPLYAKKTVVCLNNGFFGKVHEASSKFGVSNNSVRAVCDGRWFATKGLFFVWSSSELSEPEREMKLAQLRCALENKKLLRGTHRRRSVICLKSGIVHESGRAAAQATGLSPSRIMQLSQQGKQFRYADEVCR
jgi:group I intron endonuclease